MMPILSKQTAPGLLLSLFGALLLILVASPVIVIPVSSAPGDNDGDGGVHYLHE